MTRLQKFGAWAFYVVAFYILVRILGDAYDFNAFSREMLIGWFGGSLFAVFVGLVAEVPTVERKKKAKDGGRHD